MSMRIPIVLFWFVLLLMLVVGFGQILNRASAEQAQPTPLTVVIATPATADTAATSATPAPRASATAQPLSAGRVLRAAGSWGAATTNVALQMLQFAATVIGLFLVIWVVWKLVARRQSPIIVGTLIDASNDDAVGKLIDGLSISVRESLMRQLDYVRERANDVGLVTSGGNRDPDALAGFAGKLRPVSATPGDPIASVAEAVAGFAPPNVKAATKLIDVVLKPSATVVTGVLQRRGHIPARYGISFEIAPQATDVEAIIFTVWGPRTTPSKSAPSTANAVVETAAGIVAPTNAPALSTPLSTPEPTVQVLVQIARHFSAAGLFSEAITSLQEALTLAPGNDEVARRLSTAINRRQKQSRDAVAYDAGKALEQAGLRSEAINSYVSALPLQWSGAARALWRVALATTDGGRAAAFLKLARMYQRQGSEPQERMDLYDASLELYARAAQLGSDVAVNEQVEMRARLAHEMVDAARLLHQLGRFESARTTLTQATTYVPNHPRALEVQALVEQSTPVPITKSKTARMLGDLYWSFGAYQEARTHYEAALEQDVFSAETRAALARVLAEGRPADAHYRELLGPATFCLAVELARQTLETSVRRRWRRGRIAQDRADIHNFVGLLYQAAAQNWKVTTTDFYERAIASFERAINYDPAFPEARENLADTLSMLGREEAQLSTDGKEQKRGARRQQEAVLAYREAERVLELLDKHTRERYDARRLTVGRSITMLLTGDKLQRSLAWERMNQEARKLETKLTVADQQKASAAHERQATDKVPKTSQNQIKDRRLLYMVACFFAIAYKEERAKPLKEQSAQQLEVSRKRACSFLAYSLVRDEKRQFWDYATEDPDLASIRSYVLRIQRELENEHLKRDDPLHTLNARDINDIAERAMSLSKL